MRLVADGTRGWRWLAAAVPAVILLPACGRAPEAGADTPGIPEIVAASGDAVRPPGEGEWPGAADSIPGTAWTLQDWALFRETLQRADALRLDTLPLGDAVASMGALFLGTPYVPRTLEVPGPERMVVNLRALDCVTFVENVLALTRFHRVHGSALLTDPEMARRRYEEDLADLRYRNGRVDGYPSRLHYFSEWIAEGVGAGRLVDMTVELGGEGDPEPLGFMSAHPEAYTQMADERTRAAVSEMEARLNTGPQRSYLPEDRIAGAAAGIRNGDVIAATSTLAGLDVAHTGLAYWKDGVLHLLHAPLVGSTVVLSERTLAARIVEIASQDGIMVARPAPDWFGGP